MESIAMASLRSQNYNFKARDETEEWRLIIIRKLKTKAAQVQPPVADVPKI